jgi:hypothetical protein
LNKGTDTATGTVNKGVGATTGGVNRATGAATGMSRNSKARTNLNVAILTRDRGGQQSNWRQGSSSNEQSRPSRWWDYEDCWFGRHRNGRNGRRRGEKCWRHCYRRGR